MKFICNSNKTLMIKKFIKVINIINYFKLLIIHCHPNVYFYVFFISLDQYIIFYTEVAVTAKNIYYLPCKASLCVDISSHSLSR